jgi:glycosyltransferase involved in cell wall biosynthesis
MHLLVITARYPTADRPAAGTFVRDRLGARPSERGEPASDTTRTTVVAPDRYDVPGVVRYARLTWRALTARGRFDGVECHFVLPSGMVGLLAARVRRLPLVVVAHGSDVGAIAHRTPIHRWLAKLVLRGAGAVVANSPATAAAVAELGAPAEVVPPGVDLERFAPRPRPPVRRVLYVGGDVPGKGVAVARRLAHTLVGPGIREVPPEEMPVLLAQHDVLLMPSQAEGFGLAAAEAIAAGRWVVATAVGGLVDVVSDGVNGTLVRDGDYATALAQVPVYDPNTVAATAERFDVTRQREQMTEIWSRVLATREKRLTRQ